MIVLSTRFESSNHGTFSEWYSTDTGFSCYAAEPPMRGNQNNISCILAGIYLVKIRISPKYGRVFHITNVPNRSWVLIHSGNFAGDTFEGLKTHTMGCTLLGSKVGYIDSQRAILNSRVTVRKFMQIMQDEFYLVINDKF